MKTTIKAIVLCTMAFIDLLTMTPVLGSIIAFFRRRITAAFIVHPGTLNEVQKWWTFVGEIKTGTKKERFWEWVLRHLWPVSGHRIVIQNGKKNVIKVIYLSLTARLIQQYPEKAKKQSIKASRLAERLGATYIGLGGQVPGNCQYGFALKSNIKKAKITTGHAYSLSVVYAHTILFAHQIGIDFSKAVIAIVGAGSMGRGMALLLSRNHRLKRLLIVDIDTALLKELAKEIYQVNGTLIETFTDLQVLTEADIIISVASSPEPLIMPEHIKSKVLRQWNKLLIIEDGYPPCISPRILHECEDVVLVAGGATKMSTLHDVEAGFGLLPRGYTVSCFAELMICMLKKWNSDFSLGRVDIHLVDQIYSDGIELGFYPGCLSNERKLSRACRQQVEPRRMLLKLTQDQLLDSSSILLLRRKEELLKAC